MDDSRIFLVRGSNYPLVSLGVTEAGKLANLAGCTGGVLRFRQRTGQSVLEIPVTVDIPGSKVSFEFPDAGLDVPPGEYLGEIKLMFGVKTWTLYDLVEFTVRAPL